MIREDPWLKTVKAFSVLCPYHRPEPVGLGQYEQAFAAFPDAEAAHAVEQPAAVVVERVALVGSALAPIHDAFVVVAAVAEQLHVAVVAAVVPGLRRVHLAAVAVAQVLLLVQLAPHHARLAAARSAGVVAPARYAAVRVAQLQRRAAVEPAVEQPVVAQLVVHHVRDAHLAPGTSVPSHDPAPYSRAVAWPDQDGIAVLPVRCS